MKKMNSSKMGNVSPKSSGPAPHNSVLREENGHGEAKGASLKVTKKAENTSTFSPATASK